MLYAIGQIFIDENGLILKNNMDIWSHCESQASDRNYGVIF